MTKLPSLVSQLFSDKYIYQECLDQLSVLSETETFEEYPLIHRQHQVTNWRKKFPNTDIFPLWISFIIFLINIHKNTKEYLNLNNIFICITVTQFNKKALPRLNIFTSTTINKIDFLKKLKMKEINKKSKEKLFVKTAFENANEINNFDFYESRFFDNSSNTEIVRIYCVFKFQ
jgi:hypothetical protein